MQLKIRNWNISELKDTFKRLSKSIRKANSYEKEPCKGNERHSKLILGHSMFDDMPFQDKAKNGMEVINAQGEKNCFFSELLVELDIYIQSRRIKWTYCHVILNKYSNIRPETGKLQERNIGGNNIALILTMNILTSKMRAIVNL